MAHQLTAGFIGLGDIGGPMAQRIIDAGFPTTLYARRDASLAPYDAARYVRAATPAELGARSEVVGLCVFDDADVRSVLAGPDGVLAGMRPGGVVMIHATASVAVCEEMAALAAPRGVAVLDAPISGARNGAEAGTLVVMVGGEAAAVDKARPVMQAFGRLISHLGPLGAGQKMKALNNVTNYCNGRIASLAVETGQALGLDPDAVMLVLRNSGGASYALNAMIDWLLPNPDFRAHAARMILKDTRLLQRYCRDAGLAPGHMDTLAEEQIVSSIPDIRR